MGEVAIDLCRLGLNDLIYAGGRHNTQMYVTIDNNSSHESGIIFLTNISEFEYINIFFYIIMNSCTAS